MVKLYALSTCSWCKKVKQMLADEGVQYECVDVDMIGGTEQEQAVEEVRNLTGDTRFPVTVIGGKVFIGYKPEEMTEALRNAR